jgi:tRNA threonylcarbamoyl adenosine modification protein (Sua5/YciO/YrdC/YwlC family)
MSQYFQIHPENPQARLIKQAVEMIRQGALIAYPTDSAYALGCSLGNKSALGRIQAIRKLDKKHNYTLVVRDIAELATYSKVDNSIFRLLKKHTPGAYTFILKSTREVPRGAMHEKKKTIGIRIPDHPITHALLAELGEPIVSSTLILPGDEYPMTDPYEIRQALEHALDLIIDGGYCGLEPTTVIDLCEDQPLLLRQGKADFAPFDLA